MTKPETVDQYIASFPDFAQSRLQELRVLALDNAPEAVEEIKWGHPAYSAGTILFVFSGHGKHANIVFTPSTLTSFAHELDGYGTGKGSVRLPYGEPIPQEVLARMIAYRVREYEEEGIGWM